MSDEYLADFGLTGVDDDIIRRERSKARDLRRSRWWQRRVGPGICYYCNGKFPVKELTMDHLVPLARGGTSNKGNLVPACKECNTRKKTMLPLEWEEYMDNLKKHG